MSKINWMEKLGWDEDQLEDLRLTGFAYIRQGKYEIAKEIFEALSVLDPENAYDVQTLGALYLELNQPKEAFESLNKALKLDADHTPTLLNLTKALFMLNKIEEGLKLAAILQNEPDPQVSNMAKALLLAFGH